MIKEKLAACVNIVPVIKSIYKWKGKFVEDAESAMFIKTTGKKAKKLISKIKKIHSYENPCIEV